MMKIPLISKTKFNYENYGVQQGITWPVCHTMETDTYEPLDGWRVVGYCNNPELSSCTGGRRPFAVLYETTRIHKASDNYEMFEDFEAGHQTWYHYKKLPNFTRLELF